MEMYLVKVWGSIGGLFSSRDKAQAYIDSLHDTPSEICEIRELRVDEGF